MRRRASGEGLLLPDSHLFTVENVTPTLAANCSWVSPNLACNSMIIFATSFLLLSFISARPDLALLLTSLGKQYNT